jgi:8-amino-7-oxononanoate synthase
MIKSMIHDHYEFVMEGSPEAQTVINGKKCVYFGGVSYFQLHNHPEVVQAALEATSAHGLNSATSRSNTGMTQLYFDVEVKAAEFFGCEDAVYLPSGYLSNIAGIQALAALKAFDVIFIDASSHYCNLDGVHTSQKPVYPFRHNNPADLKDQIRERLKSNETPLIVSDGIFSMVGKFANIPELLEVAEEYDGLVWIDDAHGSGIAGANGQGTYEYFDLHSDRLYVGSTLSKAFGGFGGIIPGNRDFISVVRKGNVLKGGSQPVFAAAAASLKGIEIVASQPELREQLRDNASYLKEKLGSIGIEVFNNYLPIASFSAGTKEDMRKIQNQLFKKDIYIQHSNYVGAGENGVLRMVVFSTHSYDQIDYLTNTLKTIL